MTTQLRIDAGERPDGGALITVAGEIDMSNADLLRVALAKAMADGGRVLVDLTAVEYVDSAGLAVLFPQAPRLEVVAPRLLTSVLTISGLTEVAEVRIVDPRADGRAQDGAGADGAGTDGTAAARTAPEKEREQA